MRGLMGTIVIFLSFVLGALSVRAEDIKKEETKVLEEKKTPEIKMEEMVVAGEKLTVPTKQTGETVYTGTEITRKGMEVSGEKGKANVYEAISILPGVVFESPDVNNLATEQPNVRIRGVRGYLGAMTVEGIPNYGGNPMGPRAYIYDQENFDSIAVYKGAVPADLGSGVGNRGGAIELRPRWAQEKFGLMVSSTGGNFEYKRAFLRLDSGLIGPLSSRFSFSYSFSEQDKWKGPGDLGPRNNFNFTLVQPLGEKVEVKLWGNFNEIEHNKYRSLTYDQIENLADNYRLDFNESITGTPSTDYLYYKFNKEYHKNRDLFSSVGISFTDNIKLVLKPYYSKEDAWIWDGSPNIQKKPGVQKRTRDIERKGVIPEVVFEFNSFKAILGYHFESSDMKINSENYWINPGGDLTYRGYGVLATTGTTYLSSPYFKLAGSMDKFNWQAGIKYFRFKDSSSKGYVTKYDGSGNPYLERASDLDRKKKTYDIWLPTAGVSYCFAENIEAYLSYGKNFIRPYAYMPIINLYNRERGKFLAAGITLNDLFKGRDIERSHNFDLGLRIHQSLVECNPTVFFSKHKNLLTTVYDPRVGLDYQQNVGKAIGYGFELGTNLFISDWLTFFVNPTYHHLTYDADITYQGNTLSAEGKQIIDVPRWTVVSGLILGYKDFEIIPQMRYLGTRYGDVEHKYKVASYPVFDLKINYEKERIKFVEALKLSLELDNLFNKKYVAVINAMDDAISGTTFYVGAPFSVKGSLSFLF